MRSIVPVATPKVAHALPSLAALGQLRSANTALQRELDKAKKDYAAQKVSLAAVQNQLHQSELARAACEQYARKLEEVRSSRQRQLQLRLHAQCTKTACHAAYLCLGAH